MDQEKSPVAKPPRVPATTTAGLPLPSVGAARNLWVWGAVTLILALGLIALIAGTQSSAAMADGDSFFGNLLKLYMPRQNCMFHETPLIWLHIVSDALIALAYYSIPLALLYFVRRRTDLSFSWMFLCFAVFILACGTTHVMNIIAIWFSAYRVDGLVKLGTAIVSVATAITLWQLIPLALALPSPAALRLANEELKREVEVRRRAEESLLKMQLELEDRVQVRTAELSFSNDRLRQEIAARSAAELEREGLLARERAARAEAEQASRIKDEFLSTLSHELRTPLSAITGWVHLLGEGASDPAELKEGLAVIDRNARVQTALVEDLLDMSRIISGKLRLEVQRVDIEHVVGAALETVQLMANAKGVQLRSKIDPAVHAVAGDPARLQQVVWNLLSNAIKFTPAGGRVDVSVACVAWEVEISVADTGSGIAPDFLPRVFDRFHQADYGSTRRHGGLGLGLAIARHLVELHGGTIRATSEGEGRGATFIVKLPLHAATHDAADQTASSIPANLLNTRLDLEGMKVLLVDDEPDTREALRRILEQSHARVITAASATEAVDLVRVERPTVLISDIGMPGEDGYSLIKRVRKLLPEDGGLTPAVALTAFARSEDRLRAMIAGYQMHLSKPVEPAELMVVLSTLVNRSKGRG
jgi:signal transduction histidine kinase/ActR/RegA family two-component response regulator